MPRKVHTSVIDMFSTIRYVCSLCYERPHGFCGRQSARPVIMAVSIASRASPGVLPVRNIERFNLRSAKHTLSELPSAKMVILGKRGWLAEFIASWKISEIPSYFWKKVGIDPKDFLCLASFGRLTSRPIVAVILVSSVFRVVAAHCMCAITWNAEGTRCFFVH